MRKLKQLINKVITVGLTFKFFQRILLTVKQIIRVIKKVKIDNIDVQADIESLREYLRVENSGNKEPEFIQWIKSFLKKGEIIYDIGANIGLYSIYMAKYLHGEVRIMAFEPESLNYAQLNKNIKLNQLSNIIIPYAVAISGTTKCDQFFIKDFQPGMALHSVGVPRDNVERVYIPVHIQGVLSVSLDDLLFIYKADFPQHIKIDVDGLEEEVIKGAMQVLCDQRLKTVFIEISKVKQREYNITQIFKNSGFTLLNGDCIVQEISVQNYIFIRK